MVPVAVAWPKAWPVTKIIADTTKSSRRKELDLGIMVLSTSEGEFNFFLFFCLARPKSAAKAGCSSVPPESGRQATVEHNTRKQVGARYAITTSVVKICKCFRRSN